MYVWSWRLVRIDFAFTLFFFSSRNFFAARINCEMTPDVHTFGTFSPARLTRSSKQRSQANLTLWEVVCVLKLHFSTFAKCRVITAAHPVWARHLQKTLHKLFENFSWKFEFENPCLNSKKRKRQDQSASFVFRVKINISQTCTLSLAPLCDGKLW